MCKETRRACSPGGPNDPRSCEQHIPNRHLYGGALFVIEISNDHAKRDFSLHLVSVQRAPPKPALVTLIPAQSV